MHYTTIHSAKKHITLHHNNYTVSHLSPQQKSYSTIHPTTLQDNTHTTVNYATPRNTIICNVTKQLAAQHYNELDYYKRHYITPRHTTLRHTTQHQGTPHHVTLHHTKHRIIPCNTYTILHHITLIHNTTSNAKPHHAAPYHTTPPQHTRQHHIPLFWGSHPGPWQHTCPTNSQDGKHVQPHLYYSCQTSTNFPTYLHNGWSSVAVRSLHGGRRVNNWRVNYLTFTNHIYLPQYFNHGSMNNSVAFDYTKGHQLKTPSAKRRSLYKYSKLDNSLPVRDMVYAFSYLAY